MAANAVIFDHVFADGFSTMRMMQWTIGTYAANGNQFGKILDPNPSRKRLFFRVTPGTEALWNTSNKIYFSPEETTPAAQGLILLQPLRIPAETLALATAAAAGNPINAPGGVGTYDLPALAGTIATPAFIWPVTSPSAVLEHWTGKICLHFGTGIAGADKSIEVFEQSWE